MIVEKVTALRRLTGARPVAPFEAYNQKGDMVAILFLKVKGYKVKVITPVSWKSDLRDFVKNNG